MMNISSMRGAECARTSHGIQKCCAALLAVLLVLSLAACGNSASGGKIEGSLKDILAKVTEGTGEEEMALTDTEITAENFSWYFFIDPIDGAEGLASEAAINAIPHCIALLRVPESSDPEQVKADVEAKLDPRKWVCVEAEKSAVVRHGDLILVAMSTPEAVDRAVENFDNLAK